MASPPLKTRAQWVKKPSRDMRNRAPAPPLARPGYVSMRELLQDGRQRLAEAGRAVSVAVGAQVDRRPMLRPVAEAAAERAGQAAGVARGAYHAVEGLGQAAFLGARLIVPPLDKAFSPDISAKDQVAGAIKQTAKDAANYGRKVIADPAKLGRDVVAKAQEARRALDPAATPAATTTAEELQRRFAIGANQGESAFDVGTLAVGGPGAKVVGRAADAATVKAVTARKYIDQGFPPRLAEHLAAPYAGMGHHNLPRRVWQPAWFVDSEYNVLKPPGMSRGDFYERHYQVDDRFHGTGFPKRLLQPGDPKGWSGKELGLKRYGPLSRLYYAPPGPLKARVGGLTAAAGAAAYTPPEEQAR